MEHDFPELSENGKNISWRYACIMEQFLPVNLSWSSAWGCGGQGCFEDCYGRGQNAIVLANWRANSVGLDISAEQTKCAQKLAGKEGVKVPFNGRNKKALSTISFIFWYLASMPWISSQNGISVFEVRKGVYTSSMNLFGEGISGRRPLLSRISLMTSAATFSGAFSQWSKVHCQKAWPEVADRMSADKPNVSATGMCPVIFVRAPFCSDDKMLPRFRVTMLEQSPTHCWETDMPIL